MKAADLGKPKNVVKEALFLLKIKAKNMTVQYEELLGDQYRQN